MATGTHFTTNSEIEDKGGVCLVVGALPKTVGEFV
jgi:hypothetical protein